MAVEESKEMYLETILVLSQSGLAAAEYLYEAFGIPYVCGVPYGSAFSAALADALRTAAENGTHACPCTLRGGSGKTVTVIGEAVSAGSLAAQLNLTGYRANVICPLPHADMLLADGESDAFAERDMACVLAEMQPDAVIADPLYRFILPEGTQHIELPHTAFSGRCYDRILPDLTGSRFDGWLREAE